MSCSHECYDTKTCYLRYMHGGTRAVHPGVSREGFQEMYWCWNKIHSIIVRYWKMTARQQQILQSRICPAPCVLCQCTVVFAWNCHLFCLCAHWQCRVYYTYPHACQSPCQPTGPLDWKPKCPPARPPTSPTNLKQKIEFHMVKKCKRHYTSA